MFSAVDVHRWTSPLRDKYRVGKIDVFNTLAAFYIWKEDKRMTVEIDCQGEGIFTVLVMNDHRHGEHVYTSPKSIKNDILALVDKAFSQKV